MKISDLKNAPLWLVNAKTENADVLITIAGEVIWCSGIWLDGIWQGGIWKDGTWRGGEWNKGTWLNGYWESGEWNKGTWLGGVWCDGTWHGGVWCGGEWKDGNWLNGVWKGGEWLYGTWRDGTWENGVWYSGIFYSGKWFGGLWVGGLNKTNENMLAHYGINSKYEPIIEQDGRISIGCQIKSIEDWVFWFENSNEEFDTPRNTRAFNKIKAHFYALKTFLEIEKQFQD